MKAKRKLKLAIILLLSFAALCVCAVMLLNTMIGYTAGSTLAELNSKAEYIYRQAEKYVRFDIVGTQTFVGYTENGMYYAVIIECGSIKYTLASNDFLDENELTPTNEQAQLEILSNIFTHGSAIGYYDRRQAENTAAALSSE